MHTKKLFGNVSVDMRHRPYAGDMKVLQVGLQLKAITQLGIGLWADGSLGQAANRLLLAFFDLLQNQSNLLWRELGGRSPGRANR